MMYRKRFFNRKFLRRLAQRFQLSENAILLGLAVIVGLASGVGIWVFQAGIHFFTEVFREDLSHRIGAGGIIFSLTLAGFLVGLLVYTFVGEERHHGVAGVIESVTLVGGKLPYKRIPFKALAASLSIGAGASVGPEDPSVQIGSNMGSFLGQQLSLSEDRVRVLVAAGSASAIAAAFNAPIAGVFFALEVILGNFASSSVGVVVLAAVMSSVFTQSVAHGEPELGIRAYELGGPAQVPFYIMLGCVCAPIAALFIRAVYWQADLWHHWHVPTPFKTALAGFLVGVMAIFYPEIMGAGRETMNEVLNTGGGDFTIQLLLTLVFVKILMTSVSMAGGFVGGIFAPSLFVGAMLGGAYGRILLIIFPDLNIGDPAAYAIAGMAAMMAGIVRAPITAILMIFELTNNYQLILPIMLATVITIIFTEYLEPDGIYTKALRRVGLHIQHGRDVDVMQSVLVREVMRTPPPVISPHANLTEIRDALRREQSKSLCVIDDRRDKQTLRGIVTLSDLQTAYETASQAKFKVELTAADICSNDAVTVSANEPVLTAIQRMGLYDFGSLPVVAPDNDQLLLGLITEHDVMRSYNIAMTRKWENQYAQAQIRLKNLVNENIISLRVPAGAEIVGKEVRQVKWPPECIVVSVRRGNHVILPHGDTVFLENDEVILVTSPDNEGIVSALINAPSLKSLGLDM